MPRYPDNRDQNGGTVILLIVASFLIALLFSAISLSIRSPESIADQVNEEMEDD